MKPVIFVTKNDADKVEMTRKEFSKMVEEIYEQGYADGARAYCAMWTTEIPTQTQTNVVG